MCVRFQLACQQTNAAVFDNRGRCAPLITNEGHWAEMFVRKAWEPQKGWKGRGEKHIEVCRSFIDLCTRWGYVRGWHCNSLEPPGERGSQGQSDKTTVCEAGNNIFWVTLTPNSKAISEKRIKAIKDCTKTNNQRQLLSSWECVHIVERFIPIMHSWKALESPDNRERAEVMWQDWKAFTQMVDAVSMICKSREHHIYQQPDGWGITRFTWHAKCNSEKMHNFESCPHFSLQRRMARNTTVVYQSWNRCAHHVQTCWTHL